MYVNYFRYLILVIMLLAQGQVMAEQTLEFSSGSKQNRLIELYTSQGCSSCPPAEKWLNQFVEDDRLWKEVVPVAFHVDYWDYLGWQDPYADSEYSNRQRVYRLLGNTKAVYTPGFVVNGQEWRGWFSHDSLPEQNKDAGVLVASLAGDKINIYYDQPADKQDIHVALLGFGIETPVKSGENGGRTLAHEFVVLSHQSSRSNSGQWQVDLPQLQHNVPKAALAVWVSQHNNLRPLQATGGWLPINMLARK